MTENMDWLDAVDVNEIPDDAFLLPKNTYLCESVSYKEPAIQSKDAGLAYFILNWQITQGSYETYSPFGQWIALPPIKGLNDDEYLSEFKPGENRKHMGVVSNLNNFFVSLGFEKEDFKTNLRKIMAGDFDDLIEVQALVDAYSEKNSQGFHQVKVTNVAPCEEGVDYSEGADDANVLGKVPF